MPRFDVVHLWLHGDAKSDQAAAKSLKKTRVRNVIIRYAQPWRTNRDWPRRGLLRIEVKRTAAALSCSTSLSSLWLDRRTANALALQRVRLPSSLKTVEVDARGRLPLSAMPVGLKRLSVHWSQLFFDKREPCFPCLETLVICLCPGNTAHTSPKEHQTDQARWLCGWLGRVAPALIDLRVLTQVSVRGKCRSAHFLADVAMPSRNQQDLSNVARLTLVGIGGYHWSAWCWLVRSCFRVRTIDVTVPSNFVEEARADFQQLMTTTQGVTVTIIGSEEL